MLLCILTIISYKFSKREICNPAVLFISPFFLMSIIGIINKEKWELNDMKLLTTMVLVLGTLAFLLGCIFQSKIKISHGKANEVELDVNKNISRTYLLASLVIELVALGSYSYLLTKWGLGHGAIGLSASVNLAMMNGKFGMGETFNLPFMISSLVIGSRALCYIYSTILAKNIVYRRKGYNVLLAINIIIPIFINLLGGSRGSALEPIVAFGVSILFYYYKSYDWNRKLKTKYVLIGIGAVLLLIYIFFSIKGILGRNEMDWSNFYDDFYRYFGAQEKNLDYYLSRELEHSTVFGYATLTSFYNIFNTYLGLHIKDTIETLSFVVIKGVNLGNVYTCFYNYYIDFGIFGVFIFSFVSGWCSQYLYRKAKYSSNKIIDSWLVIYSYAASCLVFCFFGNRFYNNLLGASFFRMILWIYIIKIFLLKTNLKR